MLSSCSAIDLSNLNNEDHPNQSQKQNSARAFVEQTSLRPLKMISFGQFLVFICGKKSSNLYHLLQVTSQLEKTMTQHKNFKASSGFTQSTYYVVILLSYSIIDLSNLNNEDHPNQSQKQNSARAFVEQTSLRPLKKISLGPFQVYICGKKSSDLYNLLQVMSQLEKTMTHHKKILR